MARPTQPTPAWDELVAIAADHGIERIGVAPASVLARARIELHRRKSDGLHNEMGFTFRDPNRSTDPQRTVSGARSVIVAARPYRATHEPERPDGAQARAARYVWVDHYEPLRAALDAVADRIRSAGHRAVTLADDNSLVDREAAHQAGIGWFGKNANLLVPGAGSFFVLGSVITTVVYPRVLPIVADGCGGCQRCIDGCPTGAIIAPGVVDGHRCLAWLVQKPGTFPVEYREALGDRLYGCDDCQEVCPPTMRLGERRRVDLTGLDTQAWVDVVELLESSDDELIERYGRWYLADRNPVWWRRNALIVLGNTAGPHDRRAVIVLERYQRHDDPVLREHADWAAARIERRHRSTDTFAAGRGSP